MELEAIAVESISADNHGLWRLMGGSHGPLGLHIYEEMPLK